MTDTKSIYLTLIIAISGVMSSCKPRPQGMLAGLEDVPSIPNSQMVYIRQPLFDKLLPEFRSQFHVLHNLPLDNLFGSRVVKSVKSTDKKDIFSNMDVKNELFNKENYWVALDPELAKKISELDHPYLPVESAYPDRVRESHQILFEKLITMDEESWNQFQIFAEPAIEGKIDEFRKSFPTLTEPASLVLQNQIWAWATTCRGVNAIYEIANKELEANSFHSAAYLYNFIIARAVFSERVQKCISSAKIIDGLLFKLALARVQMLAVSMGFSIQAFDIDAYLKKYPLDLLSIREQRYSTKKIANYFRDWAPNDLSVKLSEIPAKISFDPEKRFSGAILSTEIPVTRDGRGFPFYVDAFKDKIDFYSYANGPVALAKPEFTIADPDIAGSLEINICPISEDDFLLIRKPKNGPEEDVFLVKHAVNQVVLKKVGQRKPINAGMDFKLVKIMYCEKMDERVVIFERLVDVPGLVGSYVATEFDREGAAHVIKMENDIPKFEKLYSDALRNRPGPLIDSSLSFIFASDVYLADPHANKYELMLDEQEFRRQAFENLSRDAHYFVQFMDIPDVGIFMRVCSKNDCGINVGFGLTAASSEKLQLSPFSDESIVSHKLYFDPLVEGSTDCPGGILKGVMEVYSWDKKSPSIVRGDSLMLRFSLCLNAKGQTKKSLENKAHEIELPRQPSDQKSSIIYVKKDPTLKGTYTFLFASYSNFIEEDMKHFVMEFPASVFNREAHQQTKPFEIQRARDEFLNAVKTD